MEPSYSRLMYYFQEKVLGPLKYQCPKNCVITRGKDDSETGCQGKAHDKNTKARK